MSTKAPTMKSMVIRNWFHIALMLSASVAVLPLQAQEVAFHRDKEAEAVQSLYQVRFWDNRTIAFSGLGTDGVHFLDLGKLRLTRSVDVMQGRVDEFEFTPDRQAMVITTFENEIAYYDFRQQRVLHQVGEYFKDYVTGKSISFTPEGNAFGVTMGCQMLYWDKLTGLAIDSIPEPEDECLYEVAFSADGSMAFAGGNSYVWMYNRIADSVAGRISVEDISVVNDIDMRPDHQQLAVAAREGLILLDTQLGGRIDLKGHEDWINELVYSPDGRTLYSCSGSFYDKEHGLRAWDTKTGACLGLMSGHFEDVEAVAISPNGKWIASASRDGSLKLWNAGTLKLALTIVPMLQEGQSLEFFCFTPGGGYYGNADIQQFGELSLGSEALPVQDSDSKKARKAVRKAIGKF